MTTSPSTSAVRARNARLVVAFGIVALLLGDVWRLPHLLFSRHVVCREHGELVHDHEQASPLAPGELATETAKATAGEPASHGHEHCSSLATSGRGAAVVLPPQGRVDRCSTEPACELASVVAEPAHPLTVLLYAPKQGPPA